MDQKLIQNLVERRHPEYGRQKQHWDFCELSYRGGREYMCDNNVFRYFLEDEEDYKDRLARTYRANHTKRVVDTINLHLFKQPVQRNAASAPEPLKNWWEDPTGNGKISIDAFVKEIDQWASVYGILYLCVDNTPFIGLTQADEAPRPYAYLIHPQRVLDVAYDGQGQIIWIALAEDRRDDANPFTSTGKVLTDVRLWMRDAWYLFGQKTGGPVHEDPYELIDMGENRLGEVPIIRIQSEEGTPYSAPALIGDIAYMDRALVNYGSALDEVIYGQTFSQLAIPAQGVLPGTTGYAKNITAARNRIFMYEGSDPGNKPFYLAPDAAQATLIISAMQVLMRNIYAVTGTDNEANSQSSSKGKEYASGVVREFDYSSVENILVNKARAIASAEERAAVLVLKYAGNTNATIDDVKELISYSTSFDIRGLEADLNVAQQLNTLQAPAALMKEQLKIVTDKAFPRLTPEEREKMRGEIEMWQPQTEFDREQKKVDQELKKKAAEKPVVAPQTMPSKK